MEAHKEAIYLRCDITLAKASEALHVVHAHQSRSLQLAACPRIATQLHASLWPAWEGLSVRGQVYVAESCKCGGAPSEGWTESAISFCDGAPRLTASSFAAAFDPSLPAHTVARRLDENRARLTGYRLSEAGCTGALIGTGPSLRNLDLRRLGRLPTIGCNKLFLLDDAYHFRPRHLVIEDRLVLEDSAVPLANYRGTTKWYPIDRLLTDDADLYFPLWRSYDPFPQFTGDFSENVFSGSTVSYVMLQLAAFLGWTRILLVGMDGNDALPRAVYDGPVGSSMEPDQNHFDPRYYGPGQRFHSPRPDATATALNSAARHLNDIGIEVFNCSPRSMIEAFPRRTLEELAIA